MTNTPPPDPAVVLTDAECEQWALAEALDDLISDRGVTLDDDRLGWLAEFVAARTADAAARLAAVDPRKVGQYVQEWHHDDVMWDALPREAKRQWDEVGRLALEYIRASLSAPATDAGQREAQERAEGEHHRRGVPGCQVEVESAVGSPNCWCPRDADHSPEQP